MAACGGVRRREHRLILAFVCAVKGYPLRIVSPDAFAAGSRSARDCAEPDLVSVGVSVSGLARAVRVRLSLRRLQSALRYLGDQRVEVINDDGVHGVAGVFRLLDDVHRPVFGEFPHSLGVVGEERRRGAEQPLVPGQRSRVVTDWYTCEQVDGHAAMLAGSGSRLETRRRGLASAGRQRRQASLQRYYSLNFQGPDPARPQPARGRELKCGGMKS